jgi:hypothetical protein
LRNSAHWNKKPASANREKTLMATITPTNQVNAQTMAANWGKGVAANSQKWLNAYLNPRRLFNADPTGAQSSWNTGIQRALTLNSYANGLKAADPNVAANNASQFGVNNYANSGTQKAYKFTNKSNSLAAALNAVGATVQSMPRGKGANNEARMLAQTRGMAAYKGKITNG